MKRGLVLVLALPWFAAAAEIDFNLEIRPILSNKCFHCHGFDAKERKAKLRLDTFEGATRDLGGHAAIVPGKPEQSALMERVGHHDPNERMPPVFSQGASTPKAYGRDHHSRCFTMWMAGGGIKPGITYGASDDFSYNPAENPVHVHDLQATILHQLGINHERLTYRFQGRDYRLTDVHGHVVHDIIS